MRWLLWPLAALYRLFQQARAAAYARGWLPRVRLPAKVVSVGNLTVGGTGKTPMVMHLAAWLGGRGAHVAVLTRGYARDTREPLVINGRGDVARYTPDLMGDEPILLARRLPDLTIGIGADRAALARRILDMESDRPPDVFLLDDGFQHLRLARDLDLVLVDASAPFADELLLPAGRLREPLAALARADLIVLTRAEAPGAAAAREAVRRANPRAPVFRATTKLLGVLEAATHRPANLFALKQQPVFAFCGLGNPRAFFDDLRRWGFEVAAAYVFPDHHRYALEDVKALSRAAERAGARALLLTEKDLVNLSVHPPSDPPWFYCRTELELEDEAAFFAAVAERLGLQVAVR
jgi:tetraacyldisaccharide 4'-kinase